KVTVLEAVDRVMARVTSPVVSEFYADAHRGAGVDLRLGARLAGFEGQDGHVQQAVLEGGEAVDADLVVIGVGVLPNQELAADAGLKADNGIWVDEFAATEDPDIYAIGDCTNHPSALYGRRLRLESVHNALEQAKTAAQSICGAPAPYDQAPWFWSDQYDLKLQTVGLSQGYDEFVVRGHPAARKFAVFYLKEGALIAVDAVNAPAEFLGAKKLVAAKMRPDKDQLTDPAIPLKSLA
ncbi:MAG: oxidoreductase C-terminal domain-containing protein, partial [Pseudomonadota bacterium]